MNRVRVLGSGPHTPTQFFWEYPPPPPGLIVRLRNKDDAIIWRGYYLNSRKGQRTNQKYRNLVGSDGEGLNKLNLEKLTVRLGLAVT